MQRLSGLDASFLYLETPKMPMHVGLVAVFDPSEAPHGYEFERLVGLIQRKSQAEPTLRRCLVEVPFGIDHPRWREEPEVDLLHHVRRVTCPVPGGLAELAELSGRIMGAQLDRGRPLWELWIVEGLAERRFAVIAKVHHAISDGLGGAQLLSALLSTERSSMASLRTDAEQAEPETLPDELTLLSTALRARFANPNGLVSMLRRTSHALTDFYARRREDSRRAGGSFLDAPRLAWNAPIESARITAFAQVPLDTVRSIRKALKVTGNEIVLAVCAGALRRLLLDRGQLPYEPLVAACPVAVHTQTQGDNRISAMVTSLATHLVDPVARLKAIVQTVRNAKVEHDQLGGDLIASWAELASPAVVQPLVRSYSKYRIARLHPPLYNLAISNVPGPRKPLYFAGSRLTHAYPLGPVIEGVGLNITVMSYVDQLGFGFNAAQNVFPDLKDLADLVAPASAELLELAHTEAEKRRGAERSA